MIPRKISPPESRCYRIYIQRKHARKHLLLWPGILVLGDNNIGNESYSKKMKSVVVISIEASTKLIIWWVLCRGTSVLLLYSLILCFSSVVYIPLSLLNPLWTNIERRQPLRPKSGASWSVDWWYREADDAVPRAVIGCLVFWGAVWSWRNIPVISGVFLIVVHQTVS